MQRLSRKDLLLVSFMMFSLFFGAGNLIFPPFLGQSAGTNFWQAMSGFIISAVGLPILGVVAVAKSDGLHNLAKRVHPVFAFIFTLLIYLSIGPFLGIPRNGSLAFEMGVAPFLPVEWQQTSWVLFLYTLVYFSIAFWLCLNPAKLSDRFGKVLTPSLLILLTGIFIYSLFKPLGFFTSPIESYIQTPYFNGFLDGYLTMDTIAALNFGIVISVTLKQKGIKEKKSLIATTVYAGLIAGAILVSIYVLLGYLGAASTSMFGVTENGAQTLTNVVLYLFGKPGVILLGLVFSLACLTTSVGLITSCSQYFTSLVPRVSYKMWVSILALTSMFFANMGLSGILSISVPILSAIYPLAIALIVLSFTNDLLKGDSIVYTCSMLLVGIVSVADALGQVGIHSLAVDRVLSYLPLHEKGLGWVVPGIVGALIGYVISFIKKKNTSLAPQTTE
ncbi:branched-chain amino acid transport system II carrier protein [Brevibacillus laterosporus]|uniref:Branched-chain amino acid transport system carrier protein n=1 Tax=Brevibacillus laterosporus LMG 15441 TaxID=1042163 RepID=A0A075R0N2_BRELA|nr:branched-chain amino acid transport system II carrier protein [Brevibacillus laterosporus]AIG26152.1 branched-chain amino acid transport protein [Brevibacillus laterosporus LMG 15441]RJL12510.1 branched-chain amino acid transport system II carrier protein [Brevibacillus laterosporus]TPH07289.1 branched-chain amino acid transport system II carrier protein [Brevibacillus laterosporus]